MHIEQFRSYALSKKGTSEDFPFDEVTLCLRVMGKIFAITGLDAPEFKVNLKCNPDFAIELRERYDAVQPGWHMNKANWNTVAFESGELPAELLYQLVDHSYACVVKTLKKAQREALESMDNF
ncbi:MAG: MmcQ/YjbR family DNA-binding protein [Lewinellaceae bacterium]|nr:MmcQ/YjbR family DNA-binding protein [Lewinellaceae bacterium]